MREDPARWQSPNSAPSAVCVACGTRFYDLAKTPGRMPEMRHRAAGRAAPAAPSAGGNAAEDRRARKAPVAGRRIDVEPVAASDEAEEDVLEDTSDLEDDADAIGPDIEVEPEGDETER